MRNFEPGSESIKNNEVKITSRRLSTCSRYWVNDQARRKRSMSSTTYSTFESSEQLQMQEGPTVPLQKSVYDDFNECTIDLDLSIPRSITLHRSLLRQHSISSLSSGSKTPKKSRNSTTRSTSSLPPIYQGPREGSRGGDDIYCGLGSFHCSLSYSSSCTEQSADIVEQETADISGLSFITHDTSSTTCSSRYECEVSDLECEKRNEGIQSWAFLADDHLVQAHYDGDSEDLTDVLSSWGERGGCFSISLLPAVISKSIIHIRRSYRSTPVLYAGNLKSFHKMACNNAFGRK